MFKKQSVMCLLLSRPYLHLHNPFLIIYQCIFMKKDTPSLTEKQILSLCQVNGHHCFFSPAPFHPATILPHTAMVLW